MKHIFLAASALMLLSGVAAASDLPSKKAPVYAPAPVAVTPAFSWTGFYVGGFAGGVFAKSSINVPAYTLSNHSYNSSSFAGGLKVGFNYQFGNLVAGLEDSITFHSNRGLGLSGGTGGEQFRVNQNISADIVGKLGMAFGRTLIYAKGGVAAARLSHITFVPGVAAVYTSRRVGWTLGAGVDYAVTDNFILGADYSYADYGRKTYVFLGPVSVHQTAHNLRVSAAYKF